MLGRIKTGLAALSASVFLVACASDQGGPTGPIDASYSVNGMELTGNSNPEVGFVKLCLFGQPEETGPFAGQFTISATGGTFDDSESLSTAGSVCSYVWIPTSSANVDVTATIVGPAGFKVGRIVVLHTTGGTANNVDISLGGSGAPGACEGTNTVPNSATAKVSDLIGAAIWFKMCDSDTPPPPPPPPPGDCNGLTPGYWKNWKNHYTAAQFETLVNGTSFAALSNTQATAVLMQNNPALPRMLKFLLANELTLSLLNNPSFPNPDGAFLEGTCAAGGSTLSSAIALALAIKANPGAYTDAEIMAAGTVLDALANL